MDNLYFDRDMEYKIQSVAMVSPKLRRDRRERETERKKLEKKKKDEGEFTFDEMGDGTKSTFNFVV